MTTKDKPQSEQSLLEDTYVNLSQQGASLIHHVSTPLAISRVNVEFLNRYLHRLIDHYQSSTPSSDSPPIPEEHIRAMSLAPQLINEQLDVIQKRVKDHWQSLNREVTGRVPDYQISLSGNANTLQKLIDKSSPAKILLVEDEVIHRDIAMKILSTDFDIDSAQNGEEALQCCQTKTYDLILMDLYLPGMNGQEAAKRIRSTQNDQAIIVGLTNMPLGNQEENDNLNAYLSKPLTLDALNSCLAKIRKISAGKN